MTRSVWLGGQHNINCDVKTQVNDANTEMEMRAYCRVNIANGWKGLRGDIGSIASPTEEAEGINWPW
jgi:hypothetical protein